MRSGTGAMSLPFNNFFVNFVFPTPLPAETSIEKGCFSETSILYHNFYVNDILKVALLFIYLCGAFETFPPKTINQHIQCHTYSYPKDIIL